MSAKVIKKRVVIVLPTFNEAKNIEKFTKEVLDQGKNIPDYEIHLLIADDVRSNDGTEAIGQKLAKQNPKIHFIKVQPGLGVALITAHQYSLKNLHPDIMTQIDADNQVEVGVLPKLVNTIEDGYDLAIGSRFVKGGVNQLSLIRKIFSAGASLVFRILVGPFDIKEVTNSARAFTPELFKKLNLARMPWQEKTFIIQPAFLNEAILAGAKYKEVPLIFRNRAEGYSKNKTLNYTYDVITYSIDARLHKWGLNIPFFHYTRRAKTLLKFGAVGFVGTLVDFIFYKVFINHFGIPPATSKGFSAEIAILNNFLFNNFWTFKYRKTKSHIFNRFLMFNLVSLGGVAIAVVVVKILHSLYGDSFTEIMGLRLAYNNFYFLATIPPVLIWNFTVNNLITWKHQDG